MYMSTTSQQCWSQTATGGLDHHSHKLKFLTGYLMRLIYVVCVRIVDRFEKICRSRKLLDRGPKHFISTVFCATDFNNVRDNETFVSAAVF